MPGVPTEVPVSFLALFGSPKGIILDLSEMADDLPVDDHGAPLFDWYSFLSNVEGYGRHAIGLIRGLVRQGAHMRVKDLQWLPADQLPADIDKLRRVSPGGNVPARIGVTFTLGYDPVTYSHPSPIRVAITQFETDRLPRKHVDNLNRVDHVIVTSSFCVDVFRESGVRAPISVMRPGIEVDDFPFVERKKDGLFKVLMLGALTGRKDPVGAVSIFKEASRGNPDWRLTLKTRAHVDGTGAVMAAINGDPRITLITRDDPAHTIRAYYYGHDCLLWPSKGEGVGLPPLEAMATGMELVCSDNSGMSDYVDKKICYPIKTGGRESANCAGGFSDKYVAGYGEVGNWWVPDHKHAVAQLERCFHNWLEGKGKGRKAAEQVRQKHTSDLSALDILEVVGGYS